MVALSVGPGLVNGVEALLAVSSGADKELAGRREALDELRAGSAARLGDVLLEVNCHAAMRMEGVRGSRWAEAFPHGLLVLSVGPVHG
tara:strand:- start:121 stop:384 length:264 start_codon:yes stop_codon:yes gene_type:complete